MAFPVIVPYEDRVGTMYKFLIASLALASVGAAVAAPEPGYGPPPAWVRPLAVPNAPVEGAGQAVQLLLIDRQINFTPQNDQFHDERVMKILTPQGLAALGNLAESWNPDTEILTINKLWVIREGRTIDLLAGGKKFQILRRETDLEMAMLDGTLTAAFQPEGLQVGDILDMAITHTRRDPVYAGNSEGAAFMFGPGVIGRTYFRVLWARDKAIQWKATLGLGSPAQTRANGQTELVFDLPLSEAPKAPKHAPSRFYNLGQLQLSQFADWSDVSTLMAPLYAKASTLDANSPLKAEISKIKAASPDPKKRAALALQFVQDQVRYLFLGMNNGGYVPAAADLTWTRRFGDCKGKTALLLALLHGMNIEAAPTLVTTTAGDGLDERLPMLGIFDHVMVRAVIDGKTYWLDGTRTGDLDLDELHPPPFRWVLPVLATGGKLVRISLPSLTKPASELQVRIDASAGPDIAAPSHVERIIRGDVAIGWNLVLTALNPADAQRRMREYWTGQYPWITTKAVTFVYDAAHTEFRLRMDGDAVMPWVKGDGYQRYDIGESSLGYDTSFRREPGPFSDAPFAVAHPDYDAWSVNIVLPEKGAWYTLTGGKDIDRVVAGVEYKRTSRIDGGVVTMQASSRSLAEEFPASEATAAAAALREMSQSDVSIYRSRLPSQADISDVDETTIEPTDAAGFNRRAVAYLLKRDYDKAIADFSAAIAFEPTVAKHFYNRGVARFQMGDSARALADFDHAIQLNPKDELAITGRAKVILGKGDDREVRKTFDDMIRTSSDATGAIVRAAMAFEDADKLTTASAYYDRLVEKAPGGAKWAQQLNARCWSRAISGERLEYALVECNAALKLTPGAAQILDSRGLVELRLGRHADATRDYGAALVGRPDQASSLYGLGIAKRRAGRKNDGDADIAGAVKIDPNIATTFARWGVSY